MSKLHLVFGGRVKDPRGLEFENPEALHIVGIYPDYASAEAAWRSEAQRTVDNAHMRYFLGDLQKLIDASTQSPEAQD